jgi:hypothetical protein
MERIWRGKGEVLVSFIKSMGYRNQKLETQQTLNQVIRKNYKKRSL